MSVADRMAILDSGRIRQIGAPAEVYDSPASVYVARLLGSPMMNILTGRRGPSGLEAAEGSIALPVAGVPADVAEIGIRPESLKVEPWSGQEGRRPAKVFEVEPLGGYTVVTLDAGSERLRALMRGQPVVRPDSEVALSCDPGAVHFFDRSGQALPRQAANG
jgi:multiple sugar transport system ATP-binding protein